MAIRILKPLLILLAVFGFPTIAKIVFHKKFNEWFVTNDSNPFTYGIPITKEGIGITLIVLALIIISLITITNYFP